jgi:hypothetical protein
MPDACVACRKKTFWPVVFEGMINFNKQLHATKYTLGLVGM